MFKDDPVNFFKNTRIGKAVTRALSDSKFKLYDFVGTPKGGTPKLNYGKVASAIVRRGGLPVVLGAIGLNAFGGGSATAAEVKQPEVGTPIKYD